MLPGGDTIAAIATAAGPAALGIVRVSGPAAQAVLHAVVPSFPRSGSERRVIAATARHPSTGEPIDEVLCFFARGPRTSTGENTCEIHGHGGEVVLSRLLEAACAAGARPAEPGEFTYRAFCNGRLDLMQAEAVAALIGARSERAARVALGHLRGTLGRALEPIFEDILAASAEVEAGLDFPEEDLPQHTSAGLGARLARPERDLGELLLTFPLGSRLTKGATVAIVGAPNAGKSSLLNRLVGEERVLVDTEPGTTRDVIEARTEIDGIPVGLLDTAGLRDDAGRVERQGMDKAFAAAARADLLIAVIDGAAPSTELPASVISLLAEPGRAILVALNKSDLPGFRDRAPDELARFPSAAISALTGSGIPDLLRAAAEALGGGAFQDNAILTTQRQRAAVRCALDDVVEAKARLEEGCTPEIAASALRAARESLAGLLGRTADEDLLDALFSRFCIGK